MGFVGRVWQEERNNFRKALPAVSGYEPVGLRRFVRGRVGGQSVVIRAFCAGGRRRPGRSPPPLITVSFLPIHCVSCVDW